MPSMRTAVSAIPSAVIEKISVTGGISIVRAGLYNRKLILAAMTAGSLAALLGVMLAISMNPLLLNILLILVMLMAVVSIFKQ